MYNYQQINYKSTKKFPDTNYVIQLKLSRRVILNLAITPSCFPHYGTFPQDATTAWVNLKSNVIGVQRSGAVSWLSLTARDILSAKSASLLVYRKVRWETLRHVILLQQSGGVG